MAKPKTKFRVSSWHDPIYGMAYTLLLGSRDEASRWLTRRVKHAGEVTLDKFEYAVAMTWFLEFDDETKRLVLWFPAPFGRENLPALAHEAFHAVSYTMDVVGLPLDEPHDEAYAYYLGWVFRECLKRLDKETE